MKKKIIQIGLASLFLSSSVFSVAPSATASQTLSMVINSSSNITTSGNPGALTVTLNPDGTGTATDATTTYTVVSNTGASGKLKVTGAITTGGAMPSNTALTINLASTRGTSAGVQTLGTSTTDLVTNIPTLVSDTGAINYGFTVTNGWTIPAQTLNRTVTLTLTSAS